MVTLHSSYVSGNDCTIFYQLSTIRETIELFDSNLFDNFRVCNVKRWRTPLEVSETRIIRVLWYNIDAKILIQTIALCL